MELVYTVIAIIGIIGGLFGFGAIVSHRVNANFDRRYEQDKAERAAERAAAKQEAEEREQARIDRQMLIEEQLVAVGHVSVATAEAHLTKCGPNEKITTALDTYADCRKRSENQLRKSAARYEQRVERVAQ